MSNTEEMQMNDMSTVIIPRSDQINADDLLAGPMTITIERVDIRPGTEQPVSIVFAGSEKYYRPCKSMARVMVQAWGPDANAYVGRSLMLYRDPKVKWGGMAVGGIRISHMSHIERIQTMALTETKGKRAPYTVEPLRMEKPKPANQAAAAPQAESVQSSEFIQKMEADLGRSAKAPKEWLRLLIEGAADCPTMDDLAELHAFKGVVNAEATAPDHIKAEISAAFKRAAERLAGTSTTGNETATEDDGWPGPK